MARVPLYASARVAAYLGWLRYAPAQNDTYQAPPSSMNASALAFIRYSSGSIFFFEAIFSDFQREYKEYLRI